MLLFSRSPFFHFNHVFALSDAFIIDSTLFLCQFFFAFPTLYDMILVHRFQINWTFCLLIFQIAHSNDPGALQTI